MAVTTFSFISARDVTRVCLRMSSAQAPPRRDAAPRPRYRAQSARGAGGSGAESLQLLVIFFLN